MCNTAGSGFPDGVMVLGLVIIGAVLLDVTRESMAAKARRKEAAAKAS